MTTAAPTCAAPGCDNVVVRTPGRTGRPPIYCSATCRPSRPPRPDGHRISVEATQDEHGDDGPRGGRTWTVTLRRGPNAVIVGHDLGRFAATALTGELRQLLHPRGDGPPPGGREAPPHIAVRYDSVTTP